MRTVYKYPLQKSLDDFKNLGVNAPDGPIVLSGFQSIVGLCVWIEVNITNDETPMRRRRFEILGTGQMAPPAPEAHHVHSWIDGPFVWHLYELEAS